MKELLLLKKNNEKAITNKINKFLFLKRTK